jgi:predicted Rossmann fold nucleotide-binding protein DprA/Smf involved in DNA uptake
MITADSQAILLLCSYLGQSQEPEYKPLTLKEWNDIAHRLQANNHRPDVLLEWGQEDIVKELEVEESKAKRIKWLIARKGSLAFELERLESIGIRVLTRADSNYPKRYRQRLKELAPSVLYYAGEKELLGQPGIAVVGSRHLDDAGKDCAELVGNACGFSGLVLYSGGAKGVDTISMQAAVSSRGTAVGILSDSLEKAIRTQENRTALERGDLCLATPYTPTAGFSVGAAMGRNRLIYCLADYAIIVASDFNKGGTWAGAVEALKAAWIPIFVLKHDAMPEGNKQLLQKGALPFPHPFPGQLSTMESWLKTATEQSPSKPVQEQLF